MPKRYINHVLLHDTFPIIVPGINPVQCELAVLGMRYDEEGYLFFPVSVYADEEDIYISAKYRLYPNGNLLLIRKSGDVDDSIESQISQSISSFNLSERIIDFTGETKYDEIIEAQSC